MAQGQAQAHGPVVRWVQRVVDVQDEELQTLLLSAAYFFLILTAYYIIRPIRDEMGVAGGVDNLPWMFTGTLVLMLLVNPPFAAIVARFSRKGFVSISYRFFMSNLVIFFILLKVLPPDAQIWVGRAFYWWVSIFNLFVVSIFWAFMSDVWKTGQSKRLYGFIGVGGTLGNLLGASITTALATFIEPAFLLLLSVVLLEAAVWIVLRLSKVFESLRVARGEERLETKRIGGSMWAGITHVFSSPYLLGIACYMLGYTIVGTVLYVQQADIASQIADRGLRTAFFGGIDSAVAVLTIVTQVFLTGRFIKWVGVAVALTFLPLICIIGFAALGFWPAAVVIVVFQVLRRAANFAIARPAKETLFTVVTREDRFKAKPFIDTAVYRAGDQVGVWSEWFLGRIGFGVAGVAFIMIPIAGLWLMVGYWLGLQQTARLERDRAAEAAAAEAAPA